MFQSKTSLFLIVAKLASSVLYQSPYVSGQSFTGCVATESDDVVCLWSGPSPIVLSNDVFSVTLGGESFIFSLCDTTVFSPTSCVCSLWIDPADTSDFNIDETCNACYFTAVTEFSFSIIYDCTNRLTGECAALDSTGCIGNGPQPAPTDPPRPAPIAAPRPVPRAAPRPVPRAAPRPVPRAAPRPVPRAAPRPVPRAAPRPVPITAPQPIPTNPPQFPTNPPQFPTNPPQFPTKQPQIPTVAPIAPTIAPFLPTVAPVLLPPTIAPILPTIAPQLPPVTGAPIVVPTTEFPTSAPISNTIQAPITSAPMDVRTTAPILGTPTEISVISGTSDGNAFGKVHSMILGFVIMFGMTVVYSIQD